jgi:hypothetical protein
MSNLASSAAAIGCLLCAGGFAAWILWQPEEGQPPPLRIGGATAGLVAVASPDIGPLASYDCNDFNPFIPLNERERVREAITARKTKTPPPKVTNLAPPTKVIISAPTEPDLPVLDAANSSLPRPLGILVLDGRPQVHVEIPGHDGVSVMAPGDTVDGWTLESVENGISARLRSPEGASHDLPIAVAAAVATSATGTAAPTAPIARGPGKAPGGGTPGIDAAQMAQLAKWLTPQTIDAILARPDKDQVLQQIATRLGGTMTPAQVEAMARQLRDAKSAQVEPAAQNTASPRVGPGRNRDAGSNEADMVFQAGQNTIVGALGLPMSKQKNDLLRKGIALVERSIAMYSSMPASPAIDEKLVEARKLRFVAKKNLTAE